MDILVRLAGWLLFDRLGRSDAGKQRVGGVGMLLLAIAAPVVIVLLAVALTH